MRDDLKLPRIGEARAELHNLLAVLFTAEELRRWIRYGPDQEIAQELPGTDAPTAQVIEQTISAFERHGRIDHEFFDSLRRARPGQQAAVNAVARLWGMSEHAEAVAMPRPPPRSDPMPASGAALPRFMSRFHTDTGVFPVWPPASQLAVGDFGTVSAGAFRRHGNLTQHGIEVATSRASIPVVRHTSNVQWIRRATTTGECIIELQFTSPGAYYFEARDVEKLQLDGWHAVGRKLTALPRGLWEGRWHLVVETWRVAAVSMIVADAAESSLTFTCVGEPPDSLAATSGELRVIARTGGFLEALQVRDTYPVFDTAQLRGFFRPHLRDPSGGTNGIDYLLARSTIADLLAPEGDP